ncbi:hypothetical protein P4C99_03420 [Pontiellaceae bacterium B1224]|nr:hypothetical protein [Pontiellaceae bacterium B1224]
MATALRKELAHKIIDELPEGATWDDLMQQLYVREAIERGYADSQAGRVMAVKDVRAKYGLSE